MDGTRRSTTGLLCGIVWRSAMGFYSKSFRFEGGGRQVIGLKRTGKSCRLRWVNYLHPGLKRGKMTPHEEKLVLELHSQWGNRWSKIARRLPGRTDNEIKNYWRTHMRKKAQERKRATNISPSTSTSSSCSSSISSNNETSDSKATTADITAGSSRSPDEIPQLQVKKNRQEDVMYTLDDIWKDITSSEAEPIKPVYNSEPTTSFTCPLLVSSPLWEYNWSTLADDEGSRNMYFNCNDPFLPSYGAP